MCSQLNITPPARVWQESGLFNTLTVSHSEAKGVTAALLTSTVCRSPYYRKNLINDSDRKPNYSVTCLLHLALWFPGCVKLLRCPSESTSSTFSTHEVTEVTMTLLNLFILVSSVVFFLHAFSNSVCPLSIVQFILVDPTLTSFPSVVELNTHIFPINRKSINSPALHCS